MRQLIQPSQIIKIIQDSNSENDNELFLVQEHSLVQLKDNNLKTILEVKDKIIDALSIQCPLPFFQIALLYQTGYIQVYYPKTKEITFELSFKNLKMPYKLYYIKDFFYVSDYIQGMIMIDMKSKQIQEFVKNEAKIICVSEVEKSAQIFYYTTKKLMQFDQKSQKESCLLQNQHIQRFSNISKIYVKNNIMIIYSYKTVQFYQLSPFKELNCYSKLITNRVIDIVEYGNNQNKYLIVQENGQLDLITVLIEQQKTNHLILVNLNIEDIRLCFLSNHEKLVIVSNYGISAFDQNFCLNFQKQLCTSMINLFEFQNNIYGIKMYSRFSQPFFLKDVRYVKDKQTICNFPQQIKIKQILQINQFYIILTLNQILLYQQNRQLQELSYNSIFYNCTIVDNKYFLLSNNSKLQLYQIQDQEFKLNDQIVLDVIQLKSHFQQNQVTVYNASGIIQLYQIEQDKLILKGQSSQFLDLSSYHISQQNLTICRFDCQLSKFKFPFSTEIIEAPSKIYQLNSIALFIYYNQIDEEYSVICQNGQFYIFDNQFNVKIIRNTVGINNIVQEVQSFQNHLLLTILDKNSIKYVVIEESKEYYIQIVENDEIFLTNQHQYCVLNKNCLSKVDLSEKVEEFLDVNLIPNQEHIIMLKDNILITQKSVYRYYQESFEIIQNFEEQEKVIKADIQGENVVILFGNATVGILKVYEVGQINYKIHQIKENYLFQYVKLSKDIIILTYQNEVTVYSLNKFEKLDQFKAIYPDKNISVEEQILQIHIDTHSETQLILNLLIQYAGIAIIYLRLSKNNGIIQAKLNKKIYSPINTCEHLRMQVLQSTWQLFNIKNECQVFKQVHHFFDSSLQPIQTAQKMNDCVVDSIISNGIVYYLGISGALWSLNLDL